MTPAKFLARVSDRLTRRVTPRTFGVRTVGRGVHIDRSTRIEGGRFVRIDDGVSIGGSCWILVPDFAARPPQGEPVIRFGAGTAMGGYCTVSAVNHVHIHESVLFGPRVWVTDHNHVYTDISRPVLSQGWTSGGGVDIEDGCWIAAGAVIIGSKPLRIGRGSVVGANAVVTSDVPAHCVVGGNPARILRRYDPATATWQRVDE